MSAPTTQSPALSHDISSYPLPSGGQNGGSAVAKLTARTIDSLWRKGNRGRYADADSRALYFQVSGPKAASWLLRYQLDSKRVEMGLGPYPELGLAEAREKARTERRVARVDKVDPLELRRAEQSERRALSSKQQTIRQLATEYAAIKSHGWTQRTPLVFHADMRFYVLPIIGDMLVRDVTVRQIKEVLDPIWLRKPPTATKIQGYLSAMFDYAEFHELRIGNPAKGITKYLPKQPEGGHFEALPFEEVPELIARLREYQNTSTWLSGRCNPIGLDIIAARKAGKKHREIAREFAIPLYRSKYYARYYRYGERHDLHNLNFLRITAFAAEFLLLAGTPRTSEVLKIQWKYLDEANRLLIIPRLRMKVKTGDDHIIPLTARPMAIIEEMKTARRNDYVFPGMGYHKTLKEQTWGPTTERDPDAVGAPLSHQAIWHFIKTRMGYPDITTHGFRRTFKNWATRRGFRDITVEFCLDHKYGTAMEQVYRDDRLLDERRALLQAWSDYCDGTQADIITLPIRATRTS